MRSKVTFVLLQLALLLSAGCATTGGPKPTPERAGEVGTASFYSHRLHGRKSASGKIYDEEQLTAAHRTLPFGTRVRVTNLENDRSVVVTIIDRGPFRRRRVIDVSRHAAELLGFVASGTTRVLLEVIPDR
jgi:rare lipoprotein A